MAQGKGRVVIASSRSDEVSWALRGMNNSLFTHYLLEALRGQAWTLGDGYVRVLRFPPRRRSRPRQGESASHL